VQSMRAFKVGGGCAAETSTAVCRCPEALKRRPLNNPATNQPTPSNSNPFDPNRTQPNHPNPQDDVTSVSAHGHEILAGSVDGTLRRFDVRMGRSYTDDLRHPVTAALFTGEWG
jgi:hypothetical protein